MAKNAKGDKTMTTLHLKDMESRVHKSSKENQDTINHVTAQIKNKNLRQGRVRPKDSAETRILNRFNRK
ncbi:hypothetical protein [Salibacterium lacus]|uniref:Uncharacterized protein n=1 Tax=Salibacterium lacus TaxID=1898109 RepID=A0ABW5T4B7_9BACI